MNVVRIMGGLGNQMFQYAFGRANVNPTYYTLSWYAKSKNVHRPYRLNKFNTKVNLHYSLKNSIYEKYRGFDMSMLKMDNFSFVGYWQYYPYFKNIIPQLREELCVREEFYNKEFIELRDRVMVSDSVSVHVRRGDYVFQKGFHDLPFHYYIRALSLVKGEIFMFSDDIPWCRQHFDTYFSNITYVDLEDYLSFELMKLCKKNICANSTFSYWAAILNDYPDKVVVTPHKWLGDQEIDDKGVRFPMDWIKIPDYAV